MRYDGGAFQLTPTSVLQPASSDGIERNAFVKNNTLTTVSAYEQKITRRTTLPQTGPLLESNWPILNWAFLIARHDFESNINDHGISAGANFKNSPMWVRDTCLTSMMGLSSLYPQKTTTLLAKLLDEKMQEIQFEQYRGFYEDRYFTLTDQILWVMAVEKHSRVTGNYTLFREKTTYALRTISRILRERFDVTSGVFIGGASLFDGHSGFTKGMTGPYLCSASISILYMHAFAIFENIPWLDTKIRAQFHTLKEVIIQALQRQLWLPAQGHFAHFQFKKTYREERLETLGNLFALGSDDISYNQALKIASAIPAYKYGPPALYPWYNERIPYHSGAIWPFMMGIALWAKRERTTPLPEDTIKKTGIGLDYITGQLLRTSMLEQTFMELVYCNTGRGHYSPSQVWSAGAMFALIEYGIFGMKFSNTKLSFKPTLPSFMQGSTLTLKDINIRGKKVTLELNEGKVRADGEMLSDNILDLTDTAFDTVIKDTTSVSVPVDINLTQPKLSRVASTDAIIKVGNTNLEMAITPDVITVFPAEEQIGSYVCEVSISNTSTQIYQDTLLVTCPDEHFILQPQKEALLVPAGTQKKISIRIGFKTPPVHLAATRVSFKLVTAALPIDVPLRRLFTLDMTWRVRPLFKQTSQSFERDFSEFEYWDKLRVPMRAEFRHGPYQGVLWYAKRSVIPKDWEGKNLNFYCGAMSTWDIMYINGTEIGRTGNQKQSAQGQERRYTIPAEIVKFGEINNIAIKVWCAKKENGIWKGPIVIAPDNEIDWAIAAGRQVITDNFFPQTIETAQGN